MLNIFHDFDPKDRQYLCEEEGWEVISIGHYCVLFVQSVDAFDFGMVSDVCAKYKVDGLFINTDQFPEIGVLNEFMFKINIKVLGLTIRSYSKCVDLSGLTLAPSLERFTIREGFLNRAKKIKWDINSSGLKLTHLRIFYDQCLVPLLSIDTLESLSLRLFSNTAIDLSRMTKLANLGLDNLRSIEIIPHAGSIRNLDIESCKNVDMKWSSLENSLATIEIAGSPGFDFDKLVILKKCKKIILSQMKQIPDLTPFLKIGTLSELDYAFPYSLNFKELKKCHKDVIEEINKRSK